MTYNIWIEEHYDDNNDAHMRTFKYDKTWIKVNSDDKRERVRIVKYGIEPDDMYTVFYIALTKYNEFNGEIMYAEDEYTTRDYISTLEDVINEYDLKNKNNEELINSIDDIYE